MNIKQYIESGILDNYVLGLVTENERAEVEQHAQKYPGIKQELDAIENALADYAQLHQVSPPAHLKAKVLQEIESLSATSKVSAKSKDSNNIWLGLLAALLLLSGIAALYFYGQHGTAQEELSKLQTQFDQQVIDCDSIINELKQQIQGQEELLNFMNDEATKATKMQGTEGCNPNAVAEVRWNPNTQQAFVDIGTLPAPPSGHQYQLWAFVNDTPVSMDLVDLKAEQGDFVQARFIAQPQMFAVSLEAIGPEKPAPKGTVCALGKV